MEKVINGVTCKVVPTEYDVYFDMALAMLEEIIAHNEKGEKTVMIVPVGPTNQYPILAEMVNRLNVSLKNVHFFNMDEYMLDEKTAIAKDDELSFYKRMYDECYSQIREDLIMPEDQRHFPEVGKEAAYDALIESLGGVDLCLGGLGINGHVAFNEAPEADDPITVDEFAALGTRVLPLTRETKTINAYGYKRGDLRGMPEWCITIGMKQILSARSIYIAINRPWQHGTLRRVLFDEIQPQIPASLLRRCEDVRFCIWDDVARGLFD
jgi:glucosamine-6-phosphate deaminase